MKIIDLSMPLNSKTPTYPGDPSLGIEQIANIKKQGWEEKRIHCNTHCGTHVDAPAHMISGGKTLDLLPLETFSGNGVVIDVRKKEITEKCLQEQKIVPHDVVIFLTGQSERAYSNYYQNAKFIPSEVAEELVKLRVKAVGIDSFSPDEAPFPIHKILLSHNIIIIENMVNIHKLVGKKHTIQYFPLHISDADGAPCRALAFVQ